MVVQEATELDYTYTDCVLLADALLDQMFREADILDRDDIIEQIQKRDFDTNPESFKKSLDIAVKARHGEHLTARSLPALKKMKTYKVKDLNTGFALSQIKGASGYSEIVSVHNASKFRRLGVYLLPAALKLGGKYLECFGEFLSKQLYTVLGFEVYKTIENAKMSNGKITTLYFMKLKGTPTPQQ